MTNSFDAVPSYQEDDFQESSSQGVNTELIKRGEEAMIDIQVATARKYPRNIRDVTRKLVAFVSDKENKKFAESCQYAVPRGGKSIVGPSVHLAKLCAQMYGNMRIAAKVVDVSDTHITSQGMAWDLENNVAMSKEVMKSITSAEKINGRPTGKRIRYADDMVVVTGNAANSIALRNAILDVIPKGLVETVYKAAQDAIIGKVSSEAEMLSLQERVVTRFKEDYKVPEDLVLKVVGKAATKFLSRDDIQVLMGIGTALKDGDTTVEQAFYGEGREKVKGGNKMSETINKATEAKSKEEDKAGSGKGGDNENKPADGTLFDETAQSK